MNAFYLKVTVFIFIGLLAAVMAQRAVSNIPATIEEVKEEVKEVQNVVHEVNKIDEYWLALNIYYEARSEPLIGKIAVGIVTMNRVYDDRYPKTVKGVVTDHMQFSWYNDKTVRPPTEQKSWEQCLYAARLLLTKQVDDDIIKLMEGATHYHTIHVNPVWAKTKTKIVQIGEHIFYRFEKNEEREKNDRV